MDHSQGSAASMGGSQKSTAPTQQSQDQQQQGSGAYSTQTMGSPGVALELATSDQGTIGTLAKAMVCLARTGEELMVEATRDKVSFRAINSAKTGFASINMAASAFDIFAAAGETYHCKVSGKSLQLAFKASLKNVRQMEMVFDHDASAARVTMSLSTGCQKCFSVPFIEGDIMSVGFSKDQCTHKVRSRPMALADVLQNMHKDELKIQFGRDVVQVHGFSEVALDSTQKAIVTTIDYESRDFDSYDHTGNQTDLIFAMREFRTFLEMCDGLGVHFCMHFSEGGQPLIFVAETDQSDRVTIEMVVATVVHDETTSQMSQSSSMMGSQSTDATQSRQSQASRGYRSDSGYRSDASAKQQRDPRDPSQSYSSQSSADCGRNQRSRQNQQDDGWAEQDEERQRHDEQQRLQQQQHRGSGRSGGGGGGGGSGRRDGGGAAAAASGYDRRDDDHHQQDRSRRAPRPRSPEFDDEDNESDTYSLGHQHARQSHGQSHQDDDDATLQVDDDDADEFVECTPPDEDNEYMSDDQSAASDRGGDAGAAGDDLASQMIGMTPQEADDDSSRESLPMM